MDLEADEDEDHEADEGQCFSKRDAEEHGGTHHAGSLRLASHGFDGLADDVANADARSDGGDAVGKTGTDCCVGLLLLVAGEGYCSDV